MVRLVCGCLNVQIHAKSAGHPVDPSKLEASQINHNVEFFNHELREVLLNLEGIHVEHSYLLMKDICDQWTVHHCNNCQMTTHATRSNSESELVLVSSDLLSDEQMIERLVMSPEYSQLFKIVVKQNSENTPVAIEWVSKEMGEMLQLLQSKLNAFLVTEEQVMEERIREFEEQERDRYAKLQTKVKNEKNAIFNTILVNIYKNVSESLVEAMKESPVDIVSHVEEALTCVSPLTFGNPLTGESQKDVSSPPHLPVSRSESSRSRKSEKPKVNASQRPMQEPGDCFDDDVFHYDPGFQDDPLQPPFSESDDEEQHDTDDSAVEDQTPSHNRSQGTAEFSTSMPINVPQWGRQISHIDINDDDLDSVPKDPESMAASIQALARSIHGDSSNVFGELPTSRTRARVLSSQSSYQH